MLHRLSIKGVAKALASPPATNAPWRACLAAVSAAKQRPPAWTPTRGLSDDAPSEAPAEGKRKPDWPVGTPAPGRDQTLGEAFAAMQHHARGARKVKASVLNRILERVSSEDELKYATLGLQVFKTQGIDLRTKTGTLFVKACCKAGSPQTAVEALAEAGKYGLDGEGVVSAHRFNYLLSQLYKAGDSAGFTRAVEEARSRQHQSLNARSHTLIARFEAEERAKEEEEAARVKAEQEEEERVAREAEEKAKREQEEKEKEELKAKEAAEEEAKLKEEEENKAKKEAENKAREEAEAAKAEKAAAEAEAAAGGAGAPPPEEGDAERQDASGNAAEEAVAAAAGAQDDADDAKR